LEKIGLERTNANVSFFYSKQPATQRALIQELRAAARKHIKKCECLIQSRWQSRPTDA
jgi:hypothetical protein